MTKTQRTQLRIVVLGMLLFITACIAHFIWVIRIWRCSMSKELGVGRWALLSGIAMAKVAVVTTGAVVAVAVGVGVYAYAVDRYKRNKKKEV